MPFLRDFVIKSEEGRELVPILKMDTDRHEDITTQMEAVKQEICDAMDEKAASEQSTPSPSPPESRPGTPPGMLTIQPCPTRLRCTKPPKNFGAVMDYTIFRSGFPEEDKEIEFMADLGLTSILTLVTKKESSETYNAFVKGLGIKRKIMAVEPNKEEVRTDDDTLSEAILFIMNPRNHPVYVHCNQGRHRTGCVVACLRKIQQKPMDEILDEYDTYAHPKPRKGDLELIRKFDPATVYEYAKKHDMLKDFTYGDLSVESFTDIYKLAASSLIEFPSGVASSSSSEITDDEPLTIAFPTHVEGVAANAPNQYPLPLSPPQATDRKSVSSTDSDVSSVDLDGDVTMDEVAF